LSDDDHNQKMYKMLEDIAAEQKTTTKCVTKLDKNLALHIQEVKFELQGVKETNIAQNKELSEHSARSTAIQADNQIREAQLRKEIFGTGSEKPERSLDGRLKKVEEPRKVVKIMIKILTGLGTIAGAIWAVFRFL